MLVLVLAWVLVLVLVWVLVLVLVLVLAWRGCGRSAACHAEVLCAVAVERCRILGVGAQVGEIVYIEITVSGAGAAPGIVQERHRNCMATGAEGAVQQEALGLPGTIGCDGDERAADLLAVYGDGEAGVASGVRCAVFVGIGVAAHFQDKLVGA